MLMKFVNWLCTHLKRMKPDIHHLHNSQLYANEKIKGGKLATTKNAEKNKAGFKQMEILLSEDLFKFPCIHFMLTHSLTH